MKRLIIFASGRGSNASAIIDFFEKEGGAEVALIVTNKSDAGVLDIAKRYGLETMLAGKATLEDVAFIAALEARQPALIVLAGFLLKIPPALVAAFRGKIVNIHPALLPRWGGKGMWGRHVHEAIIAAGEAQSGISIHLVDEEYDHGPTLLQAICRLQPGDDAESLAARVHMLEHFWYPRAIQFLLGGVV